MPLTKGMKQARNLGQYLKHRAPGRAKQPSPSPYVPPDLDETKPPINASDTPLSQPKTPPLETEVLPIQPDILPVQPDTPPKPATPVAEVPSPDIVIVDNGPTGTITWIVSKREAPPQELVKCIIPILEARTYPKRKSGVGHKQPKLDPLALKDLNSVLEFFRTYVSTDITWCQAALNTALAKGLGKGHARTLCAWGRACVLDPQYIPRTAYGHGQDSLVQRDEFRKELEVYLREVGKYVTAMDIVRFTSQPSVQQTWGLTKSVSKATAQRWMRDLSYRWGREPRGLYFDGHERPDVVEYRQNTYLQRWKKMESRMESYAAVEIYTYMDPIIRRIVVWFHDKCTFYANDCRLVIWVHQSASHKPIKKGEGESLMVSDLVSAEYGWLRSPDGLECAREFFRAGANRDGYFSTSHVCKQISHAADILAKYYTGEDHVFVFDNSPTHLKRGSDAPSVHGMPKFTPKITSNNFLVRTVDEDGNEIWVPMTGGYLSNGQPQSFYWPEGHPRAGWFKGMAEILKERGWENAEKILGKCKKCDPGRTDCCLHRILFNEPDFANPSSILERLVTMRGHGFLLLPKFHPELNPIERCWGKAKRTYREFPDSKGEAQLRKNVEAALNGVLLEEMRKFCTHCRRICDGYDKGLDSRLSAWAEKRYHGHRQYPEKILEEAEDALGLVENVS